MTREVILLLIARLELIILAFGLIYFAFRDIEVRFPVVLVGAVLLVMFVATFVPTSVDWTRDKQVFAAINTPAPDQISRCMEGKINIPLCRE